MWRGAGLVICFLQIFAGASHNTWLEIEMEIQLRRCETAILQNPSSINECDPNCCLFSSDRICKHCSVHCLQEHWRVGSQSTAKKGNLNENYAVDNWTMWSCQANQGFLFGRRVGYVRRTDRAKRTWCTLWHFL